MQKLQTPFLGVKKGNQFIFLDKSDLDNVSNFVNVVSRKNTNLAKYATKKALNTLNNLF